jgi:hypothetical protein
VYNNVNSELSYCRLWFDEFITLWLASHEVTTAEEVCNPHLKTYMHVHVLD